MENNASFFRESLKNKLPHYSPNPEEQAALDRVVRVHLIDLTANTRVFLDEDFKKKLTIMAAEKLAVAIESHDHHFTPELWHRVVVDYHRNGQWGIRPSAKQPPKEDVPETPAREMFRYIWVFLQAGILMKAVVLYFGLNSAADESSQNSLLLYLALAFSFLSLAAFAWRLHRREAKKNNEI